MVPCAADLARICLRRDVPGLLWDLHNIADVKNGTAE